MLRILTHSIDKPNKFSGPIGTRKRTDGSLAEKSYNGQPPGVSYTESETVEISADGKFRHMKVHNHYSGGCSQMNGITEYGRIKVNGIKLNFEIQSGSEMVKDACAPPLNKQKKIKPHQEIFPC